MCRPRAVKLHSIQIPMHLDVSWVGFERENKHELINLVWGGNLVF